MTITTAELHPVASVAVHERVLVCTGCDTPILVCGWVDDLDADSYRGVVCGCRKPKEAA